MTVPKHYMHRALLSVSVVNVMVASTADPRLDERLSRSRRLGWPYDPPAANELETLQPRTGLPPLELSLQEQTAARTGQLSMRDLSKPSELVHAPDRAAKPLGDLFNEEIRRAGGCLAHGDHSAAGGPPFPELVSAPP
jgi:hypothetical protein